MLIGLKLYRSSVPNARADKKLTLMAGFHSFTQSAPSIWAKATKIDATHRGKPQPQPQPGWANPDAFGELICVRP